MADSLGKIEKTKRNLRKKIEKKRRRMKGSSSHAATATYEHVVHVSQSPKSNY
jgi:hypothetical protein